MVGNMAKKIFKKLGGGYIEAIPYLFGKTHKGVVYGNRAYKRGVIKYYGKKIKASTLIETGTYQGDMLQAMYSSFENLYSVEIFEELYKKCVKRFEGRNKVHLYNGDSSEFLPVMIKEALDKDENGAIIFWLDGHYSGKSTGRGVKDTPIYEELEGLFEVLKDKAVQYVICIDDAREFTGKNDYPTLDDLFEFINANGSFDIKVKSDIIRVCQRMEVSDK